MSYMANRAMQISIPDRRLRVQELWQKGNTKQEIADSLQVSPRTVARDFEILSLNDKVPVVIGNMPEKHKPAIPVGEEAIYLMNKAVSMMQGWSERALVDDKAAMVVLKFADLYAKLVGAYAPEKRIQGNFKLEPPKPIEIPAEVVKDMGEIIGELQIDDSNTD